jgi:hypothetical protein
MKKISCALQIHSFRLKTFISFQIREHLKRKAPKHPPIGTRRSAGEQLTNFSHLQICIYLRVKWKN